MRTLLILLLCVLGAFVVFGTSSAYVARRRGDEAETILRQIGEGQAAAAYEETSQHFKEEFTRDRFLQFVANFRLDQYRPGSFSYGNGHADMDRQTWRQGLSSVELTGAAELRDHTRFRAALKFRRERQQWRLDSLYVTMPSAKRGGTDDAPSSEHPARDADVVPTVEPSSTGSNSTDGSSSSRPPIVPSPPVEVP